MDPQNRVLRQCLLFFLFPRLPWAAAQYQCDLQMDLEDQANAPQWVPLAFRFFSVDWSSSLGFGGALKKHGS